MAQLKVIAVKGEHSVVPHFAEFMGHGASVNTEKVSKLLSVKWDVKGRFPALF